MTRMVTVRTVMAGTPTIRSGEAARGLLPVEAEDAPHERLDVAVDPVDARVGHVLHFIIVRRCATSRGKP